jgi:hypothetical protein
MTMMHTYTLARLILMLTMLSCALCQSTEPEQRRMVDDTRIVKIEKLKHQWNSGLGNAADERDAAQLHSLSKRPDMSPFAGPSSEVASLRKEAMNKMTATLGSIFKDTRERKLSQLEAIRAAKERVKQIQASS